MNDIIEKCPFCNIDKTKLENTILNETKYFYNTFDEMYKEMEEQ